MADLLPPLIGVLKADVTGWVKSMAEVKGSTEAATSGAGKAFNGLATVGKVAFLGIGIAAVGIGATSLKMAGDFESATNRLVTSAGESRDHIEMVRKGILDMAGQVGYSAMELADAMYKVDSAGYTAARGGLTVLRAAAEGAKAENADLKTVADAVTSAMVDYHKGASDAAQVTTTLIAAVSQGKTSFQELTGSLHSVLPIASAAHISLADITAAVASMTVHGMSADQATQNLAHTIQHLQTVTAPQAKELAALGLSARQLSADLGTKGLTGTLQEISTAIQSRMGADGVVVLNLQQALAKLPPEVQKLGAEAAAGTISMGDYAKATKGLSVEAAGQAAGFATLLKATHGIGQDQKSGAEIMQSYAAALKAATGDSTTLNTALMLTGENADTTNRAVKAVSGATTEAGGHVAGWSSIQDTFNQHLAKAEDGLGAMAITIGTQLIPAANNAIDTTQRLADWFAKHKTAATALAGAIGGPLVIAMTAYIVQMGIAAGGTVIATARTIAHAAATVVLAAVTQGQALAAFVALAAEYGILNALSVTSIGMFAAKTAATIVNTAATVGVTVATAAWTAAQWLLNVALSANPIGIVILVIAGLVAGIIWAYQNVGWFHDAVNTVWEKLKQFGGWVKDTLGPIISGIGDAIGAVGGALKGMADAVSSAMGAANNANASVSNVSAGARNPARASGGPVLPGITYTVGEEGPETLVMGNSGGYVIPNARSGGGGGGSGSGGGSMSQPQVDMGGTNALLEDHNALLQEQNMLLIRILDAVRPRSAFSTKAYSPGT